MADEADDLSRAIAGILRDAFDRSDYTVRSLAAALGKSTTTLQGWLNGTTTLRITDAVRLCKLLGRDFKRVVEEAQATL